MKHYKIIYPISIVLFSSFSCFFQKSDLPKSMPTNVVISFMENGGMINSYKKVVLTSTNCIYEYNDQQGIQKIINFSIPYQYLTEIYDVFKIQSFDKITTKKSKHVVTDMGNESITISYDNKNYTVLFDSNFQFKNDEHWKRYQTVKLKLLSVLDQFVKTK